MLSSEKFEKLCKLHSINVEQLAEHLVSSGHDEKKAAAAVKNWQKGLLKPIPTKDDVRSLGKVLGVDINDLSDWHASCKYAPSSASKTRLVTKLIVGLDVQDAMDVLKFTPKRAAKMVDKVLRSAVANADEEMADVDSLYISEARVDDAGVRIGTKRWIPKDRGRAHAIRKKACHIHVTVTQA